MGIYKKANSNNFMMSKTVNGLTYFKSSGTNLKMEARANFDRWVVELKEQIRTGKPVKREEEPIINNSTFSELSDKYLEYTAGRLKSHKGLFTFYKKLNGYFDRGCREYAVRYFTTRAFKRICKQVINSFQKSVKKSGGLGNNIG